MQCSCGGKWVVKKVGGFFGFGGKKRQFCSKCGKIDTRHTWINNEYVGPADEDPRSTDPKLIQQEKDAVEFYDNHRMPCCGAKAFLEGPCGGVCMNIECSSCGTKFNTSLMFPEMRIIDRI